MTRLNKALQSSENASTGPQKVESVNTRDILREQLQAELAKLERQVQEDRAKEGTIATRMRPARFNTLKGRIEVIRQKLADADVADAAPIKVEPVEPGVTDKSETERGKVNEHRIKKLRYKLIGVEQVMKDAHASGKDSLYVVNPQLDKAIIDERFYKAEIDFLEKGGTIEEWEKTPEYTEFQKKYDALKKQPEKEEYPSKADVEALVAKLTNIDSKTPQELEHTLYELGQLRVGLMRVEKHSREESRHTLADEIEQSLILLNSTILTIRAAIAAKRIWPEDIAPTPEAAAPTLAEVEKIASYHILENLKGLAQDTRRELARKKQSLEAIHGQLEKWSEDENSVTSMKRTIALKLKNVKEILKDINARDTFQKKTKNPNIPRDPEEIKAERQQDFLEQIRDRHAIYARAIEDLSMNIRANKQDIPEYAIKAAEQELIDLIDLVNAQSMDKLLEERKISADPNKQMPYFRHYLEHIRAKTEVLLMQITQPKRIKANLEADTGKTIDASFRIDRSQLRKLKTLKSAIKRFMKMCDHYDIKAKKEYEESDNRENPKENKEVQVQAQNEIKIVDVNEPPAPWPPDPTRPPIGKPLNTAAETTPTTPATPTFPTSRPPLPFPPIFTRPPAVPPPLPRGLLFEEIITIPDDVPLDVQGDKEFDAWYVAISEKFKAREYLPGSVPDRDLLDLYAQYKEQAPLLKKIQESLKTGDLDKGLGIRTENLDTYRVDQLRHSAFEKLQYSLYEKREEAEDAINRIFEAIQKTKEYSNEIKGLEARLKAQEKILALNKNRKIDGQDAAAAVEEDQGAFIQENIAGIEAFIEDMKNNFTFYAEAAKSLKADGAQDKIYDRYAAVRGRDSTKHEKIGLLGRLNTRLWGWTSKLFPKKAVQKVWDGISGQGTLKRQEEKDKFWDMIDVMKKHRLVPQQTGSKFQEGAIAQATTNVNLLQQFIGIKFHNQRNEITPVNEELATKMFSELYNAYFNAKTQSTEYQRFARRQVKEAKEFIEEDKAEVVSLNSGISAQEDWISRVFGAEEPELIAETKKELFLLEADALEGKVTSMKVTAKIDELRETRDGLVSLQAKWDGMVSNADLTDPKIVEVIQATEKAFAKKTHELTLMQIRQSAPHPEAVVATVIGKYIIKLQDRDPQIMSRSEKEEACRQLIREIETRLRRNNGFTNATRLTIERAKRQAEVALTTF